MKITNKIVSLALAALLAGSAVAAVPQLSTKADAASKYSAYLCFATKSYTGYRNQHNDSKFANYVKYQNGDKIANTSVKNATFKKGKVNFTVSVNGSGLKKLAKDKGFNSLYVDTTLPSTKKKNFTVSKIVVKVDGKTVKTIKKPALTPDPGKTCSSSVFTQIMVVNTWNKYANAKCKDITKMPKKSLSVTVTGKLK